MSGSRKGRGSLIPHKRKHVATESADPFSLFVDTPPETRRYPSLHQRGQEQAVIDHFETMAQLVFDAVSKGSEPSEYPHKTPEFAEAVDFVQDCKYHEVYDDKGKVKFSIFTRIGNFLYRRRFGWKVKLPGVDAPGDDYEETGV